MEILRIFLKEKVLINYYVIKVILRDTSVSLHDIAKSSKFDVYK